jgi:hypothetical protein
MGLCQSLLEKLIFVSGLSTARGYVSGFSSAAERRGIGLITIFKEKN